MALVSWSPPGYAAPPELLAVRIRPGKVTEKEWWEALADRVTQLATKAPKGQLQRACKALGLPTEDDPAQAGQVLVKGNLNLRTHLELAVLEDSPFPAQVRQDQIAHQALLETDLQQWVDLALSQVNESDLA